MQALTWLGIDYGTANNVAVLRHAGAPAVPLLWDGSPLLDAAVWVDPDTGQTLVGAPAHQAALGRPQGWVAHPQLVLDQGPIDLDGRSVDPVDLAAAVFSHIAAHAEQVAGHRVDRVILAAPAGWGPRRLDLLTEAATRAGLPTPTLVPAPVAAITTAGLSVPAGSCLLVCDMGAAAAHLAVVQATTSGWRVLAATSARQAGGIHLDQQLIQRAATLDRADPTLWHRLNNPTDPADHRDQQALAADVARVRQALAAGTRAALVLPEPHPPVLLDPGHLHTLTAPVLAAVVAAADQAISTADITTTHLGGVVLVGGGARLPGLADALRRHYSLPLAMPDSPQLAVAYGLLPPAQPDTSATPTTASRSGTNPATTDSPVVADNTPTTSGAGPGLGLTLNLPLPPRILRTFTIFIPAVAAAALLIESIATGSFYPYNGISGPGFLLINATEYSMAALCGLLFTLGTATILASELLTDDPATPQRQRQATRLITTAAGGGVLLATLPGLIVAASFGVPPGPHIRWCLLATLPVAAIAACTALAASRVPVLAIRNWATRLRQPVTPILLAAVGMLAAEASLNLDSPIPLLPGYRTLAGHAGAGLLGVAIILTIAEGFWTRLAGGLTAFIAAAIFFNAFTIHTLGQGYILAVIAWWLRSAARTANDAITTRNHPKQARS